MSKIAWLIAPNWTDLLQLQRAIEKSRAVGPALPSRRLRKRIQFEEFRSGVDRLFRVQPKGGATSPVHIFYLHGSGYVFDLHKVLWNFIAGLIERTGCRMTIPLYPLAPEHDWSEGFGMAKRNYLQLVAEVGERNIVIVGDSAGGGLALTVCQSLVREQLPLPAGIALFSPWLDVSVTGSDQPEIAKRDPALSIEFLQNAGRMWARGLSTRDPRVSPLFGALDGLPPTILFSGTRDILDSDARRIAEKTNRVTIRRYEEMMHMWPAMPIPEGKRALDEAATFINEMASSH